MDMITIRNVRTGVESPVPRSLWREKKGDRMWRGVFVEVPGPRIPPEVVALKAKLAAAQKKS